jgi:5-methylcytosine-specific restriction endonuclease McrA
MRPLVEARAGHRCEVCRHGCIDQIHHRLRRSQGGTNELDNLLAVCSDCHRVIHDHPSRSYESGWLLRRWS